MQQFLWPQTCVKLLANDRPFSKIASIFQHPRHCIDMGHIGCCTYLLCLFDYEHI